MKLSPRDRVYQALSHSEPDRIPTALGGGPYGLVDEVYFKLLETLHLGEPVEPFRTGHNISYMDDRLLEKLGTDLRYVYPGLLPNSPFSPGQTPDTYIDSYGQVWNYSKPYYFVSKGILSELDPSQDLSPYLQLPNPLDPKWMSGVAKRAKFLHNETDYFVAMRMVASHGPFQTACDFRGTTNFMMDLANHRDFAQALLDQITDFLTKLLTQAMLAGGKYFDMIELPGDDYASNTNTLISPRMFKNHIKPCLEKMVNAIRTIKPDMVIMLHSDGLITSLLDEIIDLGVDVIHPLEPLPALDYHQIKDRYGKRISFLGGIDISHALPGKKEDVIHETMTRMAQLGPGGGYILAPSNHIQSDVPPENILTLFQYAHQFGKYPLEISR